MFHRKEMRNNHGMYVALAFIMFMTSHPTMQGAGEIMIPRMFVNEFLKEGPVRKLVLQRLTWENCGTPNDLGRLYKLKIQHTANGDSDVSFQFASVIDVVAPVKLDLDVKLKSFGKYMKLPCMKKILGSCTFSDLCKFFSKFPACPFKPLRDAGIPCGCPFPKGTYEVQNGIFPVPTTKYADSLVGDYSITAKLSYGEGHHLACYTFNVTSA